VDSFAAILEAVATAGRTPGRPANVAGPRAGRHRSDETDRVLESVKRDDPGKYALLGDARQFLMDKRALPRSSDVLSFAERFNLPITPTNRREQAVASILRALARKTAQELRLILDQVPSAGDEPAGLRGWSDIILDRDKPRR